MACTWVATNTASPRTCGFSRASLTLVLGPHLFHMQLNEYELYYMLFVL